MQPESLPNITLFNCKFFLEVERDFRIEFPTSYIDVFRELQSVSMHPTVTTTHGELHFVESLEDIRLAHQNGCPATMIPLLWSTPLDDSTNFFCFALEENATRVILQRNGVTVESWESFTAFFKHLKSLSAQST